MKRMRNILILLLCAALLAGCGARSAPAKALEGCRALLGVREGFLEDRAAELAGSSIGDWLAMALSACGANESYDAYLAALEQHVTERYAEQGTLDALMATEYSRTILTVSMLGGDPSAFGTRPDGTTVDLLNDGVWNFAGELGAQGLNGLIFALLAVDAGTYPEPERAKNTRAGIVEAIRAAQEPDGGFGLVSGASEADLTAMALQALAPYGRDETVERALAWLKDQMQPDGTYPKVKPAPDASRVDSQLGMYDMLAGTWPAMPAPRPAGEPVRRAPTARRHAAALQQPQRRPAAPRPQTLLGRLRNLLGR